MDYHLPAAALLLILAIPLQAAVYQWTDENGRVHFSDRPTHESATEKKLRPDPPAAGQDAIPINRQQHRQRMLEVYEKERAEKREAAAEAKEQREKRRRQCLKAKVDYENYNNAGSIYEYGESGERRYLNKEEREKYIARLKAEMKRYCD